MTSDYATQGSPAGSKWTKLGLGTGTLASLGRASTFSEVDRILTAMTEHGIRVIDTADTYGSGDCEILLGRAMCRKRESFTLVSKAGYRLSNLPGPLRPLNQVIKKALWRCGVRQSFQPDYLRRSLDSSLRRLRTDHLDAFLLHDPDLATVSHPEVLQVCEELSSSGKALAIGISSDAPEVIQSALGNAIFTVIQTPANLKVATELRTYWYEADRRGIKVIGNHIFAPDLLALQELNHESLIRAASSLLPAGATLLCGTRNPAHLQQANAWAEDPMLREEALQIALRFKRQIGCGITR